MNLCSSIADEGGDSLGGGRLDTANFGLGAVSVAHSLHHLTLIILAVCRDRDVLDGRFELQQRMSVVVGAVRVCLTGLTEVGVMADDTFVADASDVLLAHLVLTVGAVTVDASMYLCMGRTRGDGQKQWDKAVAWMGIFHITDASGTDVPVGAVETFVTRAHDSLRQC